MRTHGRRSGSRREVLTDAWCSWAPADRAGLLSMLAAPISDSYSFRFCAVVTISHAHTDIMVPLQALHLLQLGGTCGVRLGTAAGWHECGCSGRSLLPTLPMARALLFA